MATDTNRLEAHKVIIFGKNVSHVGQQKKSRLVNAVVSDLAFSEKGDRYTEDQLGLLEPVESFSDFGDTPERDIDKDTRWSTFRTWENFARVGTREQAERLTDLKNPVVEALGWGKERQRDKSIIAGMFRNMYKTDASGDIVPVSFPGGQKIAYNYNGLWKGKADGDAAPGTAPPVLTPQKLRRARILLSNSKIESMHLPNIAVEEEDIQNLLTSIEATNADYANVKRLVDGEITTFAGFRFWKVANGTLPKEAGQASRWELPVWLTENIKFKERPLTGTRVVERPDKKFRWYAYDEWQDSVLRLQDEGVVHIAVER